MNCSMLPVILSEIPTMLERRDTALLLTLLLLLTGVCEGNSEEMAGIQVHSESFLQFKSWILINGLEGMILVRFTDKFLR